MKNKTLVKGLGTEINKVLKRKGKPLTPGQLKDLAIAVEIYVENNDEKEPLTEEEIKRSIL